MFENTIYEFERVTAVIWQGPDDSLDHEGNWNVELHRPEWDEDRPFDTLQEAYDYIGRWAADRNVKCSVSFGLLVDAPFTSKTEESTEVPY